MNTKLFLLLSIFFLMPILSHPLHAISEQDYHNVYSLSVEPYRDQNFMREEVLSFDSIHHISIYRPKTKKYNQAIIILPGRMEPALKFFELVYDLKDLNYDFYLLDHRGQGFSERLLEDEMKSHVERFDHYAFDIDKLMNAELKQYQNVHIISHSMGAMVHLRYLQLFPNSTSVQGKNILIAPMMDINFAPYKTWQAVALLRFYDLINKDEDYIPGGKPFDPDYKFEDSRTTTSLPRWEKNYSFYMDYPELQSGDTTIRWTLESYKTTNRVFKDRNKFQGISMLYLEAENDTIVTNARNAKFCQANSECRFTTYKNSKHAIHSERDDIRDPFLNLIKQYLKN